MDFSKNSSKVLNSKTRENESIEVISVELSQNLETVSAEGEHPL